MLKAKKRKTSSTARKAVSKKPIAVQKKVVKKDKSKIAWQIVLGIAAALLFLFIIAKFSASVTGNVPAVDAVEEKGGPLTSLMKPILPYLKLIIGDSNDDQLLLSRILLFSIVLIAFWLLFGKINEVENRRWLHLAASGVFGILFTRWIVVDDVLKTVLMPYSAVGVALSAILPFLLIFYVLFFVLKGKEWQLIRIIGVIFSLFYLGISYYEGLRNPLILNKNWLLPYPISMIILFFSVIFYKRIFSYSIFRSFSRVEPSKSYIEKSRQEILSRIALVEKNLRDRMISVQEADKHIKELKDKLRRLNSEENY